MSFEHRRLEPCLKEQFNCQIMAEIKSRKSLPQAVTNPKQTLSCGLSLLQVAGRDAHW